MNLNKFFESLNLLYYEYDKKEKCLVLDENYSNRYTKLEFAKITYHLSQEGIDFEVLKNGSIIKLDKEEFRLLNIVSNIFETIKNQNKHVYLLNDEKVKFAKNLPLFEIKYLNKNINLLEYDYLLFTSKNAVRAINKINKNWKKIPCLVISEQTGKLVKDLDGYLNYVSKFRHGDDFAKEIAKKLKNKKVLYLRGDKIVSNLPSILKEQEVFLNEEVVYENKEKIANKSKKLPKKAKIIFTSPSTIKYFFKYFTWDKSYTAICIGNTTAKYFPKEIKPYVASNTSLKACVRKALEL